jgi:hypothetical protein
MNGMGYMHASSIILKRTTKVTQLHLGKDGFGSDTHGYEFGCHYLPHFISNSDTNTNIIEYEYKNGCFEFAFEYLLDL